MLPIIGAGLKGLQAAQGIANVAGAFNNGGNAERAAPQAAKPDAPKADAPKGDNAKEAKGDAKEADDKQETIDRFLKQLDNPNMSLADIKGLRDRVLATIKKNGMDPDAAQNAERKLNHAILKKLGIARQAADGKMEVPLTPQNQQILAALGMRPEGQRAAGAVPPAPPGGVKPVEEAAEAPKADDKPKKAEKKKDKKDKDKKTDVPPGIAAW